MAIRNPQSAIYNRNDPQPRTHNSTQRDTVLSLVMAFVIVLLLVQLWLLVEAVEGHMSETGTIILPAAVASGFCCLAASWLWRTSRQKL